MAGEMDAVATAFHPLLGSVEAVVDGLGEQPALLSGIRSRSAAAFAALGVPTRRSEEWRFTSLSRLGDAPRVLADRDRPVADGLVAPLAGGHRLVLVDGWFRPELSDRDGLARSVLAGGLANAAATHPELVEPHLARMAELDDHPFAALNGARFRDGAVLWIPDGAVIDRPFELLLVASDHDRPTIVAPRLLIVAGRNSRATVIQRSVGGSGETFSCPVTELVLGPGAVIDHSSSIEVHPEAIHISATGVRQDRDSSFSSSAVALGGGLIRNDLVVVLSGSGGDATLDGFYLITGRQHVDNHLRVHHRAPHCTSRQLYKGILEGGSRGVFNGRIVVDPGAQKTDARQSNRNLLLSDTALVNSNPQLEIFADDVRCTHGSTVGRLDDDAVFYLRSRGLDRAAAEGLLTWAFAAEVVDRIAVEGFRRHVREAVLARLPGSELIEEVT